MPCGTSLVAQMVKNPPARRETQVPSLGQEDSLEKGTETVGEFLLGQLWNLVPQPGIEPGPPALGARSLSCRTTREVPGVLLN